MSGILKRSGRSGPEVGALLGALSLLVIGAASSAAGTAAQQQLEDLKRRAMDVRSAAEPESVQGPVGEMLRSAMAERRAKSGHQDTPAIGLNEVLRTAVEASAEGPQASTGNRLAAPFAAVEPWQTNWDTFLDVVAPYIRRGAPDAEINAAFEGREVVWTGTVSILELSGSIPMVGMIMGSRSLALGDGTPVWAGALVLMPEGANVAVWRQKPVGARVTFRTTLRRLPGASSVIYTFKGSSGDTLLMVLTRDAEVMDNLNPATLAANPSSLSFSFRTGGAQPPGQSFLVTSSGAALNVTVSASTNTGGNWLSASSPGGSTPSTVSVWANATGLRGGTYSGSVRISAVGAANSPLAVPVTLTVTEAAPAGPVITGVVDGASFRPVISSGSWITVRGQNLSTTARTWNRSDFNGTRLPTSLDGVTVRINGREAPICYLSPTQINALVPSDSVIGTASVVVTSSQGSSAPATVSLQPAAPAFFAFDPENRRFATAVHLDGIYAARPGLFGSAVTTRPARPGDRILLFGTGFGPTTPAVSTSDVFSGAARLENPGQLQVLIGGTPATVEYAGLVGNGLYQFNLIVPNVADGDQALVAHLGSASSQPGLFLTIGSSTTGGTAAWQRDWDTFLDVLAPYIRRGASGAEIDAAFDGREVVWTGTISLLELSGSLPMVGMLMGGRSLALGDGTPVWAGGLVLMPEGTNLAVWRQKSIGARVTFRTTLRRLSSASAVIYIFKGTSGDTILMVLTRDAEILQ